MTGVLASMYTAMCKFHSALIFLSFTYILTPVNTIPPSGRPSCNVPDSELQKSAQYLQENSDHVSPRLLFFQQGGLWPRAQVYFTLDQDNLSNNEIAMVYEAFSEFHSKTCIRFKPWNPNRSGNYVNITSSQNGMCSLADVCMKGGQQHVQLGGLCWFKEMVIHQLGHTLCLGHENQRPVRDSYLNFRHTCPEKEIPSKVEEKAAQLGFYDYASQMHFACGWCSGGWPKIDNVTKCGYQVTEGLSLFDADYINLLYGCGGCHRHRWVPVDKLIPEHEKHMHSFGYKDRLGYPLYPCRVSFGGEIVVGKFTWSEKICSFSLGGQEHYKTGAGTEVLLIPGGLKSDDDGSEYKVEYVTAHSEDKLLKLVVPAGRLPEGENYGNGYIAYGRVQSSFDWEFEETIGKAWERDGRIPQAFFPLGGKEVSSYYFKVLTCHERQQ